MTLSLYRQNAAVNSWRHDDSKASMITPGLCSNWIVPFPPGTTSSRCRNRKARLVGGVNPKKRSSQAAHALADGAVVAGPAHVRIITADDRDDQIRRFFTFRKPQPDYFKGPTGPEQWGWLEVYPQHAFYKTAGLAEEVAVGVGQNAADGKLSVFTNPRPTAGAFTTVRSRGPTDRDTPDATSPNSGAGPSRSTRRLSSSPTGTNGSPAGLVRQHAAHGTGPVTFVDEFDAEFSRDIEPMKGGHGDNYYYQMIANIRRYKGARTRGGRFDRSRSMAALTTGPRSSPNIATRSAIPCTGTIMAAPTLIPARAFPQPREHSSFPTINRCRQTLSLASCA